MDSPTIFLNYVNTFRNTI